MDKIVMAYRMSEEGRYGRPEIASVQDRLEAQVIRGLVIELGEVFEL